MSEKMSDGPRIPNPILNEAPVLEAGAIESNSDARSWAMFAHLASLAGYLLPFAGNIIGPLVVWLMKKDEYPFVDAHGKESINFQISVTIYLIISAVLACIAVGFILLLVVPIFELIFMILAAINASNGKPYRYPLTIRFIH